MGFGSCKNLPGDTGWLPCYPGPKRATRRGAAWQLHATQAGLPRYHTFRVDPACLRPLKHHTSCRDGKVQSYKTSAAVSLQSAPTSTSCIPRPWDSPWGKLRPRTSRSQSSLLRWECRAEQHSIRRALRTPDRQQAGMPCGCRLLTPPPGAAPGSSPTWAHRFRQTIKNYRSS